MFRKPPELLKQQRQIAVGFVDVGLFPAQIKRFQLGKIERKGLHQLARSAEKKRQVKIDFYSLILIRGEDVFLLRGLFTDTKIIFRQVNVGAIIQKQFTPAGNTIVDQQGLERCICV